MINKQLINLSSPASSGGNQEEGLILHLDANDVDSYDGDGSEWVDITNHEYTPATNVSEHFNTVTYTGTGTTNPITVGFQPDLIWIKNRDKTDSHAIVDSVRGITSPAPYLASNETSLEQTSTNMPTSVQSDGFTITGSGGRTNTNGEDYVAWCFKAGGAAVSNTDGAVTSQVSVNNDLGFGIVKYTGNLTNTTSATGAPIGHGLGTPPELIIIKNLGTSINWHVYSKDLANWGTRLYLNETSAADNVYSSYPIANPTGSVFYTNYLTAQNVNNHNYIAYCFASKRGVSKVGSYVGTGAAGNKVYTGFEPAFLMVKRSSTTGDWTIVDNKRPTNIYLRANTNVAEATATTNIIFERDGFSFAGGSFNQSGQTAIYYAVAKNTNETSLIPNTDLELHLDASDLTTSSTSWVDNIDSNNSGTLGNATYEKELGDSVYIPATGFSSGDVINFSNNPVHNQTTYTIESWVKFGDYSVVGSASYITLSNHSAEGHVSGRTALAGYPTGVYRDYIDQTSYVSNGGVTDGYWHHCVSVRQGTSLKQYLDGELVGTHTVSSNAPSSDEMTLGAYKLSSSTYNAYFGGHIGQVRIYSAGLTQDQIRQNFNFTKPNYPNGFDSAITGATFHPDGYFDFSSSSNKVVIPNNKFYSNFSVSLWVRFDNVSPASGYVHNVFSKNTFYASSHTAFPFAIVNDTSGTIKAGLSYGNDYTWDVEATGVITTNTWYHVVVTAEQGDKLKLYLTAENGTFNTTPTSEVAYTGTVIDGVNNNYTIGNAAVQYGGGVGKGFLNGQISKVKMYDKVLTASEASEQFNEGR